MPKCEIDYSNTIIYKITCIDTKITDVYIGHTTNFVQRKHSHKGNCSNEKADNYKCKLYETIRNNGGWTNWKMEIVNFFNCKDHSEARQKEQEYFILLNANLNSVEPFPKQKPKINNVLKHVVTQPIYCEKCNVYLNNAKLYEIHTNTKKHINKQNNIILNNKFFCEKCNFGTCKISNYNSHLTTSKHKQNTFICNSVNICQKEKKFMCNCGKEYLDRTGLWKHKKKCSFISHTNENNVLINENEDTNLINENKSLKELMIEQNQMLKSLFIELFNK